MDQTRQILHIDMNAFYCSCHAAANPEKFARRPTAVAGSPNERHGILVTASYEARARGVRATMNVREALRKCPELVLIEPDFHLYRKYSKEVFEFVGRFTPLVEVVSIDECFADITGSWQFGNANEIASKLQNIISSELNLPCSIGIGPNRFLAKMASDFKKPMGITSLNHGNLRQLLWPLPVAQMYGIGEKTAEHLHRLRIETIGDLAQSSRELLHRKLGVRGIVLLEHANGQGDDTVSSHRDAAKSIGHSITLPYDITDETDIRAVLLNLADQVGRRVRKTGMEGSKLQVTVRYPNMLTVSRQCTLKQSTALTEEIYRLSVRLIEEHELAKRPIRLLGVTLMHLNLQQHDVSIQTSLFGGKDEEGHQQALRRERLRKLSKVTDELRNRFGEDIVVRGRMITEHPSNRIRNRKRTGTSLEKDTGLNEER